MEVLVVKKRRIISALSIVVVFCVSLYAFLNVFGTENKQQHRLQWWFDSVKGESNLEAGENISIALIDSGVDISHPDFSNCDIEIINLLDSSNEDMEHGTAMAGVICANPYDGNGLLGLVPRVKLYDIKAVDENMFCSVEKLIKAIEIAIEKQVDIISLSIGTMSKNKELEELVNKAVKNDILIIAASSNTKKKEVIYPAEFEAVVKVVPLNKKGDELYKNNNQKEQVIFSPGESIVTTSSNKGNRYTSKGGSSIATAVATGVIARIKYENPSLNNEEIKDILYKQKKIEIVYF